MKAAVVEEKHSHRRAVRHLQLRLSYRCSADVPASAPAWTIQRSAPHAPAWQPPHSIVTAACLESDVNTTSTTDLTCFKHRTRSTALPPREPPTRPLAYTSTSASLLLCMGAL